MLAISALLDQFLLQAFSGGFGTPVKHADTLSWLDSWTPQEMNGGAVQSLAANTEHYMASLDYSQGPLIVHTLPWRSMLFVSLACRLAPPRDSKTHELRNTP